MTYEEDLYKTLQGAVAAVGIPYDNRTKMQKDSLREAAQYVRDANDAVFHAFATPADVLTSPSKDSSYLAGVFIEAFPYLGKNHAKERMEFIRLLSIQIDTAAEQDTKTPNTAIESIDALARAAFSLA